MKEIRDLDVCKTSQENNIHTKIIKENVDIFSNFVYQSFNNLIDVCIFPTSFKLENITRIFKKGPKHSNENYRTVNILPNLSKVYDRCLFKQIIKLSLWL